jgi:NAD(P)H-hydrate epimerase
MRLLTSAEARQADRHAIDVLGIPGPVLMETAGRAVCHVAEAVVASRGGAPLAVVLVGPGNNGGDGFVVARTLAARGWRVAVYCTVPQDQLRGDAKLFAEVALRLGVPVAWFGDPGWAAEGEAAVASASVVVDAILGTGAHREVEGAVRQAIEWTTRTSGVVIAVDVPSGISADTGAVLGMAVRAAHTVTFFRAKVGLFQHPGKEYAGKVEVVDIGIPAASQPTSGPAAWCITESDARSGILPRPATGHKGTFGHVAVFAGSPGKSGAALLAGEACLRAGAGLVTVVTDQVVQSRIEGRVPELMIECARSVADAPFQEDTLARLLAGKSAVVVGPGLGAGPAVARLIEVIAEAALPCVLDADALTSLSGVPERLAAMSKHAAGQWVLTPHPGEAARLFGASIADIGRDRLTFARAAAERSGCMVLLKGAGTVVACPDGEAWLLDVSNPAMATAGSGDVLAGVLGAAAAHHQASKVPMRGLGVAAAALVHALAAARACSVRSASQLMARDVTEALPSVLHSLRSAVN